MILHLAVYINLQVYLLQVYKLENITLFFDGLSLKKTHQKTCPLIYRYMYFQIRVLKLE